jgi:hypothetical protein
MPGNRSPAERQRGVDGPVNRSPRSRRAARAGPADGSSRRCVDPAWFWFSSGSRACADKRRYGKDNGRSSSGYVQQPARFSACFWFGCSDFLVRILPRHIVQTISLGRVSGLAKKWRILKSRDISRHRKFGPGWPNSRVSNVMPFDFRRRMECFAVFGLSSRVSSIRSSSLEIAEKYAKIEL